MPLKVQNEQEQWREAYATQPTRDNGAAVWEERGYDQGNEGK